MIQPNSFNKQLTSFLEHIESNLKKNPDLKGLHINQELAALRPIWAESSNQTIDKSLFEKIKNVYKLIENSQDKR
jgi:hypothetical protein